MTGSGRAVSGQKIESGQAARDSGLFGARRTRAIQNVEKPLIGLASFSVRMIIEILRQRAQRGRIIRSCCRCVLNSARARRGIATTLEGPGNA
jgi:hypothetical protein